MDTLIFAPTLTMGVTAYPCIKLETPWWQRLLGLQRIAYKEYNGKWYLERATKDELFLPPAGMP